MESLESQFNLEQKNLDRGGGILYFLRYDKDRLEAHHTQVIQALEHVGITFSDAGEYIAVLLNGQYVEDVGDFPPTAAPLLEELSVINEALAHKESFPGEIKSIRELGEYLTLLYGAMLYAGKLPDAYNLVSLFIPALVLDLYTAQKQNGVLSNKELAILERLYKSAASKEKLLGSHNRIVLIG